MTLWADADSLPREVKELIGRRAGSSTAEFPIRAVFVANRPIPLPPGKNLQAVIVGPARASAKPIAAAPKNTAPAYAENRPDKAEAQTADDYIMATAIPGDILVTRDIPLAALAVEAGIVALNDRGALWTADDVKERLSLRDHMAGLREMGLAQSLPKGRGFAPKDARAFADALDRAIRSVLLSQRK